MDEALARQFEGLKRELTAYLCRFVVRPAVAEELMQTAYLRCLESRERLPTDAGGLRAWIFKVATHLAFDELKRHGHWRESMLEDLRAAAEAAPEFLERSLALVGTPETKAIAREHLVACLACVLRNLPERKAAALLLREVHDFSIEQTADCLDASAGQVKNWVQEARAAMVARYGSHCALIAKQGVCHQCVELDGFFSAGQGSPLASGADERHVEQRLEIARDLREQPWGSWHRLMLGLIDEIA